MSAVNVSTSTSAPPPEKKPNATPVLRTSTSWTPGRNLCTSPTAIPDLTACLLIRSSTTTTTTIASARRNAPVRVVGGLAAAGDADIGEPGLSP